ncbi:MAG TPA: pyruvate kinase, partial [bacterium]|nr:pyruvate kinase [bacterium]
NLLQYLFFRQQELRPLQRQLMELGFSSLGRSEAHVLYSLEKVLESLSELSGASLELNGGNLAPNFVEGRQLLERNTEIIWGSRPEGRWVRVMVTMPSEAAEKPGLVFDLLKGGMDCMRVNCAHDGPEGWGRMIKNLRKAQKELGRPCMVLMDLAGPKLRTGPIQEGPRVLRWKPTRNAYGRVTIPARVWLFDRLNPGEPSTAVDAKVPVSGDWLKQLKPGDQAAFVDCRGAQRELKILGKDSGGILAECGNTAYLTPGLEMWKVGEAKSTRHIATTQVGDLPPREAFILLKPGDKLRLTRRQAAGKQAKRNASGEVVECAFISCTLPEVFNFIKAGERVFLDDGKIGARILSVDHDGAFLEITQARPEGEKLKAEKGLNFPDSKLSIPALSAKDLEDLKFMAKEADSVSLSFAQSAKDVEDLQKRLNRLGRPDMGIVLKIETKRGFENLPAMLLQLLRWPKGAVMIARGDLAVECGYERLAEIQEEILWICEAAHVPSVWATQVLETLARTGRPSRSEITDAAMGERAECVMLNKGPYIREALSVLDDILKRMQTHQRKKSQMLRQLKSWSLS